MRIAILAVLALAAATAARADDDCRLKQIGDYALKKGAGGDYLFPIEIAGQQRWFEVGLHNPFSAIRGEFADAQKFPSKDLPQGMTAQINGREVTQQVTVGEFHVGPARGANFNMFRVDSLLSNDPGVTGVAGMDLLANFDVELDLKNSRMRLFSQDHCRGEAVYWADRYAAVPFEKDRSGHFTFSMRLDGERVHVDFAVDTGAAEMDMNVAKRIFGLDETKPGMQAMHDGDGTSYRYPFKTLGLDGVQILNPAIFLVRRSGPECKPYHPSAEYQAKTCYGTADLTLRDAELRQMRLYFAFKEKTLYATPADATLPKAAPKTP